MCEGWCGTCATHAHLLHAACYTRLDEHKHPVSVSFDQDDSNDMAMVESPADLARGLQWLSNAEEPREMEIPAGASAEDIRCEEEIEKARLRVWLATMLDVL